MTYFPASSFAEITPLFRGMRTVSWEFSVWSRINKNFLCFLVFWWDFGKYLFVFAGVSLRSTKNGTLILYFNLSLLKLSPHFRVSAIMIIHRTSFLYYLWITRTSFFWGGRGFSTVSSTVFESTLLFNP